MSFPALGNTLTEALLQIAPFLPDFALSIIPELTQRLLSRIIARTLREGLLLPA